MKKIGLIKGNQDNKIVVLTPKHVKQLEGRAEFFIESGAGLEIGFSDREYVAAGASIVTSGQVVLNLCDIILCYDLLPEGLKDEKKKTIISALNVLFNFSYLLPFKGRPIDLYSLDLMPRSTLAQSMDVLTSGAAIAGYQAVLTAADLLPSSVPMITSAGGTLRPAKFLVLGGGVAGLQAIATARRLGAIVKAFDVRKTSRTEVESLGAEFIHVDGAIQGSDGYAVEQPRDYQQQVETVLHTEALLADVIIATAKIPGKQAPLLIKERTVSEMKHGSVIVDLAADTGGNCAVTKKNSTIVHNGVTIVGDTSIILRCALSASILISGNFSSFISHYLAHHESEKKDEILEHTKVLGDGIIVNQKLLSHLNQD